MSHEPHIVWVDPLVFPIVPEFLADRAQDVATIRALLATPDDDACAEMRRRGHNMKGNGTPYGFPTISDLGRAIEAAAERRDTARIADLVDQLDDFLANLDVRPDRRQRS